MMTAIIVLILHRKKLNQKVIKASPLRACSCCMVELSLFAPSLIASPLL